MATTWYSFEINAVNIVLNIMMYKPVSDDTMS